VNLYYIGYRCTFRKIAATYNGQGLYHFKWIEVYKLNAVEAPNPVILKRSDGYEKQYKLHCPRCNLFLAYEVTEKRKSGPYPYIVEGSLTENQGVVPHDAISK
jgi:hypothetical protein